MRRPFAWNRLGLALLCLNLPLALAAADPWTLVWSDEFGGKVGTQPSEQAWNFDLGNEAALFLSLARADRAERRARRNAFDIGLQVE